jgi:16S rRNA (uracil1498-N3)-methyltransferase
MSQLQRLVLAPDQLALLASPIRLTPDQTHYLTRVLRLGPGDRFIALNGKGGAWLTELTQGQTAQLLEPVELGTELLLAVTLVAALPKGSGFDEVVRQATELGVYSIQPVTSDRTLPEPSAKKLERWQRIATEAAEQSERLHVPQVLPVRPLPQALVQHRGQASLICEARGDLPHLLHRLGAIAAQGKTSSERLVIAIGPEGGWSAAELDQAVSLGYEPVSLGPRILRAVTAPIMALSLIAAVFEPAQEQDI